MNPEEQNVLKAGRMYTRPVDAAEDEWKELGTVTELKLVDSVEGRKYMQDVTEALRAFQGRQVVTYTFKLSTLNYRAFRSMCGMPNPSLIHNGKKRRR